MIKGACTILLMLTLLTGCSNMMLETNSSVTPKTKFQKDSISLETKSPHANTQTQIDIKAGFNAKATLSSAEQCTFVYKELKKLQTSGIHTDKIWFRLNGGTISQKTMPSDWSDYMIKEWAKLQQEFNCPYIFVVNFNDSPESQLSFYQRLKDSGIRFSAIELGNEQYLPKFSKEYTGKYEEVSKRTANMTSQKYIKLCNEYIQSFILEKLPFYVQFAPEHEDKNDYTLWNDAIAKAINDGSFTSSNIHGTIHLYERDGSGTLDAAQITRIRNLVKAPIKLAVTEFGVADKRKNLPYEQFIKQEKELTNRIIQQLKNGDLLLNQVLYTDYKSTTAEIFHPKFNGITPKGKIMIELLKKYWL